MNGEVQERPSLNVWGVEANAFQSVSMVYIIIIEKLPFSFWDQEKKKKKKKDSSSSSSTQSAKKLKKGQVEL